MDLIQLINHPKQLDKETLYDLRSLLALYPYYQPARLLLLKNLYLLHDPSFDQELRKAAIYLTDRNKIFQLIEASHYQLRKHISKPTPQTKEEKEQRTIRLIDEFLESLPAIDDGDKQKQRKPTPTDAAIDYVAYLLEAEQQEEETRPQLRGQDLIDDFINNESGRIQLKEEPEYEPDIPEPTPANDENEVEEGYLTENLAKIYIKQGRYSKALEIIKRLNLNNPKKNSYFADQIRYLEKLILNNKQNNQ